MRIDQLLMESPDPADVDAMLKLLTVNGFKESDYRLQVDSVDLNGIDVYISKIDQKLPIQLNIDVDASIEIWSCPNLKSLVNIPKHVDNFSIVETGLITMDNVPDRVDGTFIVNENDDLKDYKIPPEVHGAIHLNNNGFEKFSMSFSCDSHVMMTGNKLKTFDNCPNYIAQHFNLSHNKFESLKGIHKHLEYVGRTLYLSGNPIKDGFLDLLKVKHIKQISYDNVEIMKIINDHLGKGRKGQLAAQAAMIEAGFEDMI